MNTINLDTIILTVGNHTTRAEGLCVMELAAWLAGVEHTDHPSCVSPVIGVFLRRWNDTLDDTRRQQLKPYARRVITTAGGGGEAEMRRAWLATDWLVRVYAPIWLERAGLTHHADRLRRLPPVCTVARASESLSSLNAARLAAQAARAAAREAAWEAGEAAREAAGEAAREAAGEAAMTAREAAWEAAWAAIHATNDLLHQSAFTLLEQMIEVKDEERSLK